MNTVLCLANKVMVFRLDYTLALFFVTRMKRLGKTFVLTQGYPWVTRWLRVVTRHKKYVISPGHYPPLLIRKNIYRMAGIYVVRVLEWSRSIGFHSTLLPS